MEVNLRPFVAPGPQASGRDACSFCLIFTSTWLLFGGYSLSWGCAFLCLVDEDGARARDAPSHLDGLGGQVHVEVRGLADR